MTSQNEAWAEMAYRVGVGDRLRATVQRVDRWGIQLDVGLPFDGFMDRLNVGDDLERFNPGMKVDVIVVQLAEYNHQIRVRLADS
jgi:ribosomal protein S1